MRQLVLTAIILSTLNSHAQKYKTVTLKDLTQNTKAESKSSEPTPDIVNAVTEALGTDLIYKSATTRVLSTNLNDYMVEINYLTLPALLGPKNVTKDGIFLDALRIAEELVKTKSIKTSQAKIIILRPHIITSDKKIESVSKIQVSITAFKKANFSKLDGVSFEQWARRNGQVNYSPLLINEGGKYLILKQELLDL